MNTLALLPLKKLLLTVLLSMSCFMLLAQNPLVKQWDKRFGGTLNDELTSFQQTTDGGYILGGFSTSDSSKDKTEHSRGGVDYWVVKIDSIGIKQWDKRFGGSENDYCYALKQTMDGGYILGGYTFSDSSGDKSQPRWGLSGDIDYWIVKIDSAGNKQWDKRFGGYNHDILYALQQTKDKGYILGGCSISDSTCDLTQHTKGSFDFWIVKIDSLGIKQWDKSYGGTDDDWLNSLQQTKDGGFILGGYSQSGIGGDKTEASWGDWDCWVVKVDSIGIKQWDKRFGADNTDYPAQIEETFDGNFILGAFTRSGISGDKTQPTWGDWDFWIVKMDASGNKLMDKDMGGFYGDELYNFVKTNDKGYLFSGDSYSNISGDKTESNLGYEQTWIIKTDSLFNIEWDKTLFTNATPSHHDENGFAIQSKDGCYVVANYTWAGIGGDKSQNKRGGNDYWIIKFCDTIPKAPFINLSSSDTSFCEKHCIDFTDLSTNNPTSWQWFFPGAATPTSTLQNPTNICYNTYGSFDVTLIACNAAGCDTLFLPGFITEYPFPSPSITQSNDTLYSSPAVAYQWWSADSGLIAGATNPYYIPTQASSYFVVVTDTVGCNGPSNSIVISSVNELAVGNSQLAIFPNPNNGSFTISLNKPVKEYSLHIINSLGQTIKSWQSSSRFVSGGNGQFKFDVDFGDAPAGLYFVELITNEKVYRQQFVKE